MKRYVWVLVLVVLVLSALACGSTAEGSDPAETGSFRFTVLDAQRGEAVREIVQEGNQFNTMPEPGQEYVMVTVRVECLQAECSFSPYNLGVAGSENVVYEPEIVAGVDNSLESKQMLQGGALEGKLFFLVQENETDLRLRWAALFGDAVYFPLDL
ncbi:MAG TPA: DUF4352 domain-containing protein [Bellilinea sp.]|nr:DUF4352 domain-containing protein [Bellilinea sp.]